MDAIHFPSGETAVEVPIPIQKKRQLELIMSGNSGQETVTSVGFGDVGDNGVDETAAHTTAPTPAPTPTPVPAPSALTPTPAVPTPLPVAFPSPSASTPAPVSSSPSPPVPLPSTGPFRKSPRKGTPKRSRAAKSSSPSPRQEGRGRPADDTPLRSPTKRKSGEVGMLSTYFDKRRQVANKGKGRRSSIQSKLRTAKRRKSASPDTDGPNGLAREKELAQETIDALRLQLEKQTKESQAREEVLTRQLRDAFETVAIHRKELAEHQAETEAYQTKVHSVLVELLTEVTSQTRKNDEEQMVRERYRIGRVVPVRQGMMMTDMWEEGEEFRAMRQTQAMLEREKQDIEAAKKVITAAKKKQSRAAKKFKEQKEGEVGDVEGNDAEFQKPVSRIRSKDDNIHEQMEVIILRQSQWKRDIAELQKEESELAIKKLKAMRLQKLVQDQTMSRFNGMPILHARYCLLHLIGKGGFSEVYRAFDLQDLRYVAVKIHQLNSGWSDERRRNYTKHATREYNIHKTLNHPHIIRHLDVFAIDLECFCSVLEFCEGTDLDEYIKLRGPLSDREARGIITQLFSALKFLNSQKERIIHYDLKPGNILFHKGEIKITDFGLSKVMEDSQSHSIELTSQGAGTYWYLPPECFQTDNTATISPKVDMWSAGIILYQLLIGKKPFGHGLTPESILSQQTIVKATGVDFPPKPILPELTKTFIRKCLSRDPAGRPNIQHVLEDEYFCTSRRRKVET